MNMNKTDERSAPSGQTDVSLEKNSSFFLERHTDYKSKVDSIDTYEEINRILTSKLSGIGRLLDVGNGGVFDYDTACVGDIVGLDLFLDRLPVGHILPPNVVMVQGDALNMPEELVDFDGVVMVMLIHHLVGHSISASLDNVDRLLAQAYGSVRSGGRLIVMESCVPWWFYQIERLLFRPAAWFIERTMSHPATLQYPVSVLRSRIERAGFCDVENILIKKRRFVLQFGVKVPSWLTPVVPVLFSAVKP